MNAVDVSLEEIRALKEMISGIEEEDTRNLIREIQRANRIFIGGAGRSLLSMKNFAMRLMQTKHTTYLVGEVCTPSIQEGDLLLVASGKGHTKVTLELVKKAKGNGARTAVLTQHPEAPVPQAADCIVAIPVTPGGGSDDSNELAFTKKNLPGNIPELAITIVLDGITAALMESDGQDGSVIDFMHANLE